MKNRGFTLVEIAVVLIIMALLTTGALSMFNSLRLKQRYTDTRANLDKIEIALANFVTVNGRLPCPADGSIATTNSVTGIEQRIPGGCSNSELTGVVPWRTIGLSEDDSMDGWYRRFTYRVPANLTTDNAMNLTACDVAGGTTPDATTNQCLAGCSTPVTTSNCTTPATYLMNKGLQVQNIVGTKLQDPAAMTGAAYALIGHGSTGGGAYGSSGVLQNFPDDGTQESLNHNNHPLGPGSIFIKDLPLETPGPAHFDDFVISPTILSVVSRAQTGARTH
jgi:prepilin-type N-terminal cleavage/methylation domain-containing protein